MSTRAPRPNLVAAIVDDCGYSDVGWKSSFYHTPTVDRLAREGTILTRHYAYAFGTPSRASFMSGRPPHVAHGPAQDRREAPVVPQLALAPESASVRGQRQCSVLESHGIPHLT